MDRPVAAEPRPRRPAVTATVFRAFKELSMRTRLALRLGAAILAGTVVVGAVPASAQAQVQAQAGGLASTIALSNCSAALVRYPTSVDTDRALMLTNGHCYEGGMPGPGQVVQDRSS